MLSSTKLINELPPVLFVIGVQGGGKTSDGKLIANEIGGLFFEGDDAIPENSWMKWQIEQGLPISPSQVENFMNHHFLPALQTKRREAARENKPLVVSQGLFFNKHRSLLQHKLGGDIYFVVIHTNLILQEKQITARCLAKKYSAFRTWREKKSAITLSNPYFEKPDPSLKAFTMNHLGKGLDKEFIDEFKKLSCYADLIQHKRGKTFSSTDASLSTALPTLEHKPAITTPIIMAAGGITLALAAGYALFSRTAETMDLPEETGSILNSLHQHYSMTSSL